MKTFEIEIAFCWKVGGKKKREEGGTRGMDLWGRWDLRRARATRDGANPLWVTPLVATRWLLGLFPVKLGVIVHVFTKNEPLHGKLRAGLGALKLCSTPGNRTNSPASIQDWALFDRAFLDATGPLAGAVAWNRYTRGPGALGRPRHAGSWKLR